MRRTKELAIIFTVILLGTYLAFATVSSQTTKVYFTCNGSTTTFSCTGGNKIPCFADTDMEVYVRTDSTGADELLTLTSDYSVSALNNDYTNGFTVTTTATHASGKTLVVKRAIGLTQEVNLIRGRAIPQEAMEKTLDRQMLALQDSKEELGRALRIPVTDSTYDMNLPSSVDRANKYMAFGATGDPTVTEGTTSDIVVSSFMETVVDDSTAAIARATLEVTSANVTDSISVDDPPYNATGDGVANDTTAIQAAIDACPNGGEIKFGANKTYIMGDVEFIYSNIKLISESKNTVLKKLATATHMFAIGDNSGVVENISIIGLTFEGLSVDSGFNESYHMLNFFNMNNLLISECTFLEFEGDAILLNSATGGSAIHNSLVTIEKCTFDGVNNEGRQAISIIDCNNMWIRNNHFIRCTKSTMPGAIDIESNNDHCIFKNINILENRFDYTKGGSGDIQLYIDRTLTTPFQGLTIEGNFINGNDYSNGIVLMVYGDAAETTTNMGISVINNVVRNTWRGIKLYGIKDALIEGNRFLQTGASPLVSYSSGSNKCMDITFRNNLWWRIGYDNTSGGSGLVIYDVNRVTLEDEKFIDCGKADESLGYAIDFGAGTSAYVSIIRPFVISPNSLTTIAIQKEGTHTFTSATNTYCEGYLGGYGNYFEGVVSVNAFNTLDNTGTPSVALNLSLGHSYWLTGGTTTITDLDDTVTGEVATILCKHSLIFDFTTAQDADHNLDGSSADITADSGDTLTFLSENGTTLHLMSYLDASADNN